MTTSNSPVVLIVEDEPDVAETYERWLRSSYEIRLATDGQEALDQLDETIDVVLLDRMMPKMSGGEVLSELRERGIDCRVVMVSAVDPDFDVVEMGFDEYVTKPPSRDELIDTIEQLLERATVNDSLQEYYSLVARQSALKEAKSPGELEASDEYTALIDRIETARQSVDADLGDMSSDMGFVGAVREIMDDEETQADKTPTEEGKQ